ncbi:MAG TPA: GNAT family protein [Anaerolineales bacterium]|nr:GNAT family protein [Anaerolineales bacterium]
MIQGKRVRLRAPTRTDLPQFVAWLNDSEVIAGLLVSIPMSLEDEEAWFAGMLNRPLAEHPMVIEIQREEAWIAVGNCGFHNIDWRARAAEVGIFIGEKSLWNQGYGSEAMRLLLAHGFSTLNLNRIALDVYETNPRAIRSYEKVGFVHEGRKRQAMFKDGKYFDILIMSVLRAEWKEDQD